MWLPRRHPGSAWDSRQFWREQAAETTSPSLGEGRSGGVWLEKKMAKAIGCRLVQGPGLKMPSKGVVVQLVVEQWYFGNWWW
jgi:hypothetical protein